MAAIYNYLVNPPQTGDAMFAAINEIVAAEDPVEQQRTIVQLTTDPGAGAPETQKCP